MSSITGSVLTIGVGIAAILSTWWGTYTNYVKVGLKWPLLISGGVLVVAGSLSLVFARRRRGSDHSLEGVGAMLIVFLVALSFAPPPLGAAAAADRVPNRIPVVEVLDPIQSPSMAVPNPGPTETTVARTDSTMTVPDLVADATSRDGAVATGTVDDFDLSVGSGAEDQGAESDGETETAVREVASRPYPMQLYSFLSYAFYGPDGIIGLPLELTGFAAEDPESEDRFRLTRYVLGCCAADAFPLQVVFSDPPFIPALDEWVVAEVVWNGEFTATDEYGRGVPVVEVLSIVPINPPADPYEY